MTERKHFKTRVRTRMKKTGESYSSARHQVVQQATLAENLDPAYLKQTTGMSNEAVEKKTGRDWNGWIAILDAAGAKEMGHTKTARYLNQKHQVPGWWAQMITVGYERVRGLRARSELPDGFAIGKSKTIGVPVSKLFAAWDDDALRAEWLTKPFTVTTRTKNKSLRIKWGDNRTRVDVYFYSKGDAKSLVNVQHRKLADGTEAKALKAFWGERLGELKKMLEGT